MTIKTITIIGGGACGVASYIQFIVQLKLAGLAEQVKINIIEKDNEIGKGLAFGTNQPGHLLNTQADLMGIFSFEPAQYAMWLEKKKHTVKKELTDASKPFDAYSTRRLYSDYLREQFQHYQNLAKQEGINDEVIFDEALNLKYENHLWQVHCKSGRVVNSDFVILLPGTPEPDNYPDFEKYDNYFDFPWPTEPILQKVTKNSKVGILGSSLSAIDAVMTLKDNNHKGPITMYSFDGLLPRVQPNNDQEYERKFFTLSAIHKIKREKLRGPKVMEIFRLFKKEVENFNNGPIDWKKTGRKDLSAKENLEKDIAVAESGGDAFINVLYSFRYDASPTWSWLSVEEKKKFKHWIGNEWTNTRHCMPLENARNLKELLDDGVLNIVSDLMEVKYDEGSKTFVIQHGKGKTDSVDFLINATGPGSKVKEMKSSLIQNLYKDGFIEPYDVGGINLDTDTMEVISSKRSFDNLYAAGHICNGLLLDVNSVWFNVRTIETLSKQIIKKIGHANHR
jgi:uncharacterized NAD(P)/FAD-binding protein YdhS